MTAVSRQSYAELERELAARTAELAESRAYQTAITDVLRVIGESPGDVAPVFENILASATRLLGGFLTAILRFDGQLVHLAATHNWPAAAIEDARRLYPAPPNPKMMSGRVILSGKRHSLDDAFLSPDYDHQAAIVGRWRRMLGVPLLKDGRTIGAIVMAWPEPGVTPPRQADLLQTFADQAVIAIENVRLFNETKEALEQQTAMAEILKVISSSPTDLQPVFDVIAERAMVLCNAEYGAVIRFDWEMFHLVALRGVSQVGMDATYAAFPRNSEHRTVSTRAFLERALVQTRDILADPDLDLAAKDRARQTGYRSFLAVPLLREDQCVGTVVVARTEPGLFPDKLVKLLQIFADQAVIAIENVRLFNETKEALEQQTATAEVLRVISSSVADTAPVFEKILDSCQRLFAIEQLGIFLVRDDGQLHVGAFRGAQFEATVSVFPKPLDETVSGVALRERRTVHYPDVAAVVDTTPHLRAVYDRIGNYSIAAAPMLWEDRGVGSIVLARQPPRPFSDKEIALLPTFADQAVIAIENARLFHETKEALERQTATAEILKVISSSPTDVQPVFDAIAERAMALCNARTGAVTRFDGELVHLVAYHGVSQEVSDLMRAAFPMKSGRGGMNARAILERAPVQVPDVLADPDYALKDVIRLAGSRSSLAVPMLREGQVVGAITVARKEIGTFPDRLVSLLQTFAD